jgi:hypothetical protein
MIKCSYGKNMFTTLLQSNYPLSLKHLGFRLGDKGTHSSRTMMFSEIESLLDTVQGEKERADYIEAILEDNCLGKQTLSTRKLSLQRLSELYAIDPAISLFRVMRNLWGINPENRQQIALLAALARDPLLRMTARPVIKTEVGKEFSRQDIKDALEAGTGGRFNDATLDKIVRNCSSSWTQSGHLQGRVRKFRHMIKATPSSSAYAMFLGYLEGLRGQNLFNCSWVKVLDLDESEARERADDARRLGLIDIKQSGSLIDISFPKLLTQTDRELLHGKN